MAMAMVTTTRCLDQVTLAKAVLPDDMRWNPRVGRIGEIAVPGAANEPAVTRWIEPSNRLAVGDDRCRWCLLLHLIPTATTTATAMTPVASSVAMVLVVTFVTTVELLPAAVVFLAVI